MRIIVDHNGRGQAATTQASNRLKREGSIFCNSPDLHLQRRFKEARKAYREALNLYLGDYLEEFPYEDGLNPRRDSLREAYFRGVLRYAGLEKDSGNLPEARRVLEDALFRDLSRSGCAALLIRVLALMKLTREAREWGQRHIQYLREELKEKPAPEVVDAMKQLK